MSIKDRVIRLSTFAVLILAILISILVPDGFLWVCIFAGMNVLAIIVYESLFSH